MYEMRLWRIEKQAMVVTLSFQGKASHGIKIELSSGEDVPQEACIPLLKFCVSHLKDE